VTYYGTLNDLLKGHTLKEFPKKEIICNELKETAIIINLSSSIATL
jgi:hypothetical protein